MKKVLTVLAVLVLLTGVVFAEKETHTIKVKSIVDANLPAFQLILGEITTNNGTTPVKFANAKAYAPYTAAVEDDPTTEVDEAVAEQNVYASAVNFASNGGTFTVTAKLANAAKQVKAYTLTFKNGVFTVTRATDTSTIQAPASIVANTTIANGTTGITSVGINDASAIVTFNGATCSENGTILATATYTYEEDKDIIPGTYYADVVMEVTTD